MIRSVLPALVAALAFPLAACNGSGNDGGDSASIDAERMNEHVRILASDDFAGRGPASDEEDLTTDYIAAQFEAVGLQPGGENGTFFQTVPLSRVRQDGPATITAQAPGGW